MSEDLKRVENLLRQQAAIASFGSFALRQTDLMTVLNEAARVCAAGLDVPFCKICRYRTETNDLLIVSGYGWDEGVVGHIISRADESSPQGSAFITGLPAICDDLRNETKFILPPFYGEHGIISTIDVNIKGAGKPYGVLEIDSDVQRNFDQHDINFLTGFANVLAEAVATSERVALLQVTIEQMKSVVDEKDRLLGQKKVLAEELQHRVRNNLQLVYGMLNRQLEQTADEPGQRGIKAISRRVSTLAQVYEHLIGTEMTRTTDFGGYVTALCRSLATFQSSPGDHVTLTCDSDAITLDLDVVTALGIIVAELVTNSYDHAFPDGKGAINVSVRKNGDGDGLSTMTISDDGTGFVPGNENKRHGVGLVRRLVEQIGAKLTLGSGIGTAWTVSFPEQPASAS